MLFSIMTSYLRVNAKLMELDFNIWLFYNRREKVLKSRKKLDRFGTNFHDILLAIGEKTKQFCINPEICGHYGK